MPRADTIGKVILVDLFSLYVPNPKSTLKDPLNIFEAKMLLEIKKNKRENMINLLLCEYVILSPMFYTKIFKHYKILIIHLKDNNL